MQRNWWYIIFTAILWIIFALLIGVIIWGIDKGFDFSDEGYNMLSLLKNQEDVWRFRPIYPLIAKLTYVFNPGILFFRLLRLITLLFSSLFFSIGFIAWIRSVLSPKLFPSFNFLYPIIFISTLMNYAIFYQGLSYNSLTLFLVQLIAGLFFWKISFGLSGNTYRIQSKILLLFIGFFIGILFLVKFPSAFILTFLLIIFLAYETIQAKERPRYFFLNLIFTSYGFMFFLICLTIYFASPFVIIKNIINGQQYLPAHSYSYLLELYCDDLYSNFLKAVIHHKLAIIGPVIIWLSLRYARSNQVVAIFAIWIVFSLITTDIISRGYYRSGMDHLYSASMVYRFLVMFSLILIILACFTKAIKKELSILILQKTPFVAGLIFLLAIPFVCSFGSANALSIHITQFIFSWILFFILIIYIMFSILNHSTYLFFLISILVTLNAASQIVIGYVYEPYRLNKPMTEQKFLVQELPIGNTIKFDFETSVFLNTIVKKLKSQHALMNAQPIISIYNYPGLTYLLGGVSPGNAWYFDDGWQGNTRDNCFFVGNSKMTNLDKTIFMIEEDKSISDEFRQCLNKKGILFPENYTKADSVLIPGEGKKMYLYLPKEQVPGIN